MSEESRFHYSLAEDGVHVFRFDDVTRASIDAWHDVVSQIDAEGEKHSSHIRYLYDLRKVMPTPYAIAQASKLSTMVPSNVRQSIAVLSGNSVTTNLFGGLVRRLMGSNERSIRFFNTEEDAMAWLEQVGQRDNEHSE